MARAQSYGYRVETVDEMRRSILPVKDFRTYHRLVQRLRDLRPDVVHTHSSKAGIIGRWAADRARVPVIVHTIHGLAFTASTSRVVNSVYRQLERSTAPLTTTIVCVARAMADQSLAAGIGTPEQYATVYSGMETGAFVNPPVPRAETRKRLGLADDHVAVGTIARLFHLKGHDDLLDVAPALCAEFPRLRFLWVGDGLLREPFERRIAEMGLKDRFILTGLVPPERVPELTAAMDVLVPPVASRGPGARAAAGGAGGLPVVTYDVDGNREGLIDEETGFLLPPFDKGQAGAGTARAAGRPVAPPLDGRGGTDIRPGAVRHEGDGRRAGARVSRRVGPDHGRPLTPAATYNRAPWHRSSSSDPTRTIKSSAWAARS
jgi:glycosyltransferase involved in cell wall biosynthesis